MRSFSRLRCFKLRDSTTMRLADRRNLSGEKRHLVRLRLLLVLTICLFAALLGLIEGALHLATPTCPGWPLPGKPCTTAP